MIYANKKVNVKANSAQQMALIIANVKELVDKKIIKLTSDTVFLYPQIWKDEATALNWIKCLHHYYCLKRQFKSSATLYFRHLENEELIGSIINKKPKVLIFNDL